MSTFLKLATFVTSVLTFGSGFAVAETFQGEVGLEARYFLEEGPWGQDQEDLSIRFQPVFRHRTKKGKDSLEFMLFGRYDMQDEERTHFDVREFAWTHADRGMDLRLGISRVFWGVTESQHLVDIINQTDLVESPDGEDKLGQPMLRLSTEQEWGVLDFYVLPYHRARTFAGQDGRLRGPFPVDNDNILYESEDEEGRIDGAIRYAHFIGDFDFSFSHFSGNARAPVLIFNNNPADPKFIQLYPEIDRTGVTLQYIWESTIFKFEAITESGMGDRYAAAVGGLEYTQVGLFDTDADLGWIVEYLWDERQDDLSAVFENDVFVGWRFVLNDVDSSEALFGAIIDPDTKETFYSLEAKKRLGQNWKIDIEARFFEGGEIPQTPALTVDNKTGYLSQEDFVQIELTLFF